MTQRERDRPRNDELRGGAGPDPAAAADALDEVRERTGDLLDAGMATAARALSGDSEGQLDARVQETGQ